MKTQVKEVAQISTIENPGFSQIENVETIVSLTEKKQIKIGDEFVCKGGHFEKKEDVFICSGLDGLVKVGGYKKFTETGEIQSPLDEHQVYIFETQEVKSFKSLVLISESQAKILDKIEAFKKEEANNAQRLRHVANVCKVEQMGLNKCLKLFLSHTKEVFTKKQLDLLKFETVLNHVKISRFRYNQLYTLNHMVLICSEILKANDFATKQAAKVEKQGGLLGFKADKITKISNKKAA